MTQKKAPQTRFIEPSAAGPTQKLINKPDGTTEIRPGKAHEAQEGSVSNPGVRTVGVGGGSGTICPMCRRSNTLKMHMNRPQGQRIYCSAEDCSYDTSKPNQGSMRTDITTERGVKILRGSR